MANYLRKTVTVVGPNDVSDNAVDYLVDQLNEINLKSIFETKLDEIICDNSKHRDQWHVDVK